MTFPNPADFNLVAATASSGEDDFLGVGSPVTHEIPPALSTRHGTGRCPAGTASTTSVPVAKGVDIAGPDGSTFGVTCLPARSAGKLDAAANHKIARHRAQWRPRNARY
jgi:hypothetical protein